MIDINKPKSYFTLVGQYAAKAAHAVAQASAHVVAGASLIALLGAAACDKAETTNDVTTSYVRHGNVTATIIDEYKKDRRFTEWGLFEIDRQVDSAHIRTIEGILTVNPGEKVVMPRLERFYLGLSEALEGKEGIVSMERGYFAESPAPRAIAFRLVDYWGGQRSPIELIEMSEQQGNVKASLVCREGRMHSDFLNPHLDEWSHPEHWYDRTATSIFSLERPRNCPYNEEERVSTLSCFASDQHNRQMRYVTNSGTANEQESVKPVIEAGSLCTANTPNGRWYSVKNAEWVNESSVKQLEDPVQFQIIVKLYERDFGVCSTFYDIIMQTLIHREELLHGMDKQDTKPKQGTLLEQRAQPEEISL